MTKQSKFHRDIQPLQGVKKWGIKVKKKWWVLDGQQKPATYYRKIDATKDADDFNSMKLNKEKVYTVEEYK
mgnify:CR=1 FL=1